jgi:hypothetical protein
MHGLRQLPLLPCEAVREDGGASAETQVFCPRRALAMPVEECTRCPRFARVDARALYCAPDVAPGPLGAAVGNVVRGGVVCADERAPAGAVLERLQAGVARVVVVDAEGHVVGLVERGVRPPSLAMPRNAVDLAHSAYRVDATALVRPTLHGLASARRRVAVVVTPAGPLGTVTDVELLHALAAETAAD